jgi:hypothetical protein
VPQAFETEYVKNVKQHEKLVALGRMPMLPVTFTFMSLPDFAAQRSFALHFNTAPQAGGRDFGEPPSFKL